MFSTISLTPLICETFYRAVPSADKAFAQGLGLWMVSLLALIPGPILFGYIIDSTCLVWSTDKCISSDGGGGRGNCQLYDQAAFRWSINVVAIAFTSVAIYFDGLVWVHCKDVDLYGDRDVIVANGSGAGSAADERHCKAGRTRRKSCCVD